MRERIEERTLVASARSDAAMVWPLVICTLVAAWATTYALGGSKSAAPHGFYVPVLLAAMRFGRSGALVVAVVAGLAVGPFMPLDVDAATEQSPANWITRLVIFVAIGQMSAYLTRHSLPSVHLEIDGRRLRRDLAHAAERAQLQVVFQPIIRLETGAIAGAEALVRWHHPDRGLINPADFIPNAERAGCSGVVTRVVLHEACLQVAAWRRAGLLPGDDGFFKLAVNVSASELGHADLAVEIGNALNRSGLPSEWLHLEVTETALIADLDAAVDGLMELRMLGVRLAIDDFGTGESSLAHLHRFPIDVLKIDRSFLDPLEEHERGSVLAQGVIALAHAMQLVPVVEGVETNEQARVLRKLGCDLAQGYLFSRPVEAPEMRALLASGRNYDIPSSSRSADPRPVSSD